LYYYRGFHWLRERVRVKNQKQNLLIRVLTLTTVFTLLTACGGNLTPTATPEPPTLTLTPRSTALPTLTGTAFVSMGSADKPFQLVLIPPKDSNDTGESLAKALSQATGKVFKVKLVTSNNDVLNALCSSIPTVAWADGWTMLSAAAQGCGTIAAKIKVGDSTGQRADIIVNADSRITDVRAFKKLVFCRINVQDTVTWVLPVISMRAGGFNIGDFKAVQDFPDTPTILQNVANNLCVAAVPAGTLSGGTAVPRGITRLTTTPELPFGGLVIANAIPGDVAASVSTFFTSNADAIKGFVTADSVVPAKATDFKEMNDALQAAGINLKALGQAQ
jgi:ABC-type phosphate/phosphonate transport system substrate-binding protein